MLLLPAHPTGWKPMVHYSTTSHFASLQPPPSGVLRLLRALLNFSDRSAFASNYLGIKLPDGFNDDRWHKNGSLPAAKKGILGKD